MVVGCLSLTPGRSTAQRYSLPLLGIWCPDAKPGKNLVHLPIMQVPYFCPLPQVSSLLPAESPDGLVGMFSASSHRHGSTLPALASWQEPQARLTTHSFLFPPTVKSLIPNSLPSSPPPAGFQPQPTSLLLDSAPCWSWEVFLLSLSTAMQF